MTLSLGEEHKRKILATYCGFLYYVPLPPEAITRLEKLYPKIGTFFVQGSSAHLRQVGAYFLMAWGQQHYRSVFTHEIVDLYLDMKKVDDDDDERRSFVDSSTPFLIIYHMQSTMPNRQLENMVCQNVSQRRLLGKPTLVLAEVNLPQVEQLIRSFSAAPASSTPEVV